MKKLMIGFVGALAMVASAEVESGNTVGYTGKDARADLNWYTPQFFSEGFNTTDINKIQLDDNNAGEVGWGDSMQIVGPLGSASEMYSYWNDSVIGGDGSAYYWGDETGTEVAVSFDGAEGCAIDNMNALDFKLMNSGDVPMTDIKFTARDNLNWSGNPFPANININAVQLDDDNAGEVGWGDSMQIVGPLGSASEMYSYWNDSVIGGDGATFYWGDETGEPVELTLNPGDGFAIDNMNGLAFKICIECPFKK